MNVSTYLEAFMTVYGWEVYGALFFIINDDGTILSIRFYVHS